MARPYLQDSVDIQMITDQYVEELIEMWQDIYTPETCRSKLDDLKEKVRVFYQDLVIKNLHTKRANQLHNPECNFTHLGDASIETKSTENNANRCSELNDKPQESTRSEVVADILSFLRDRRKSRKERMRRVEMLKREINDEDQNFDLKELRSDHADRSFDEGLHDKIVQTKKKIESLRNKLKSVPCARNEGDEQIEYNEFTYKSLENELKSLEKKKKQEVKVAVVKLRSEIQIFWEKTLTSEEERKRFKVFDSTCFTDDLTELHERELAELKDLYYDNQRIYELYEERQILWQNVIALEDQKAARFRNRGAELLKEEKERKTLGTRLMKIDKEITDLVNDFEKIEKKPFLVYGKNLLQIVSEDWAKNSILPAKTPSKILKKSSEHSFRSNGKTCEKLKLKSPSYFRKTKVDGRPSPGCKTSLSVPFNAHTKMPKVIDTAIKPCIAKKRKSLTKKLNPRPKSGGDGATDDDWSTTCSDEEYTAFKKHLKLTSSTLANLSNKFG